MTKHGRYAANLGRVGIVVLGLIVLGGTLELVPTPAAVSPAKRLGHVRCRGSIKLAQHRVLPRLTAATFTLFETSPRYRVLWSEVRTLELDTDGNFDVPLGSASKEGELLVLLKAKRELQMSIEVETSDRPFTIKISPKTLRLSSSGDAIITCKHISMTEP